MIANPVTKVGWHWLKLHELKMALNALLPKVAEGLDGLSAHLS